MSPSLKSSISFSFLLRCSFTSLCSITGVAKLFFTAGQITERMTGVGRIIVLLNTWKSERKLWEKDAKPNLLFHVIIHGYVVQKTTFYTSLRNHKTNDKTSTLTSSTVGRPNRMSSSSLARSAGLVTLDLLDNQLFSIAFLNQTNRN